jgi:membrane protease subunit (stomatin/prohibitin family)
MAFWNYCPKCGKRLMPNEESCLRCGAETIQENSDDTFIFAPPIHNIGFFNLSIDFSPYIIRDCEYDYDVCSCGYLNNINDEYCYHCGVKRVETGLSRYIRKFVKPKLDIGNIVVNNDIVCECGAVNLHDSEFCDMCGRKLHPDEEPDDNYSNFNLESDNPIFCTCGQENDDESQFCRNCGLPLDSYGKMDDIKILCNCAVLNDVTSDFCTECGNPLNEEVAEIICICGNRNPISARFCPSCERPLNAYRVLKTRIVCSCGKIIDYNSEFCPNCGKNIKRVINRKKSLSKTVKSVRNIWHGV